MLDEKKFMVRFNGEFITTAKNGEEALAKFQAEKEVEAEIMVAEMLPIKATISPSKLKDESLKLSETAS